LDWTQPGLVGRGRAQDRGWFPGASKRAAKRQPYGSLARVCVQQRQVQMLSAEYYRKQAEICVHLAATARQDDESLRFRLFALRMLLKAANARNPGLGAAETTVDTVAAAKSVRNKTQFTF
jgi:hypothetical protein